MTLIKSISGIRGTIGGIPGEGLTPFDILKFTAAYGQWIKNKYSRKVKIVVGRDARISGEMVSNLCIGTLQGLGIDVINLQLSTTPTVEIAVPMEEAQGGIILTASHNPREWNALKLLNEKGEFVSARDGEEILALAESESFSFAEIDEIGAVSLNDTYLHKHIEAVINLQLVNKDAIAAKNLKVVCDCVNSSGGIFVPELLRALGVKNIVEMYCEPNGEFPHNPEPLAENLTAIAAKIKEVGADLGIVVDPDVDRLAFVCEDGSMFGEEYTLVAVADHVLKHQSGNSVSNMSSTRALRDITEKHGGSYSASAVGEVNVVEKMKATNAVIGGEGNGGVIYPELHYGRDALVGIGLFLTHFSSQHLSMTALKHSYPSYTISKNKIELTPGINVDDILNTMKYNYKNQPINDLDGVKIEFDNEWVHLRKSNTEPIIRIYAESVSELKANELGERFKREIEALGA